MVMTSSSSASSHMSMPWLRQKLFVHSEHDVEAVRPEGKAKSSVDLRRVSEPSDSPSDWCSGPRAMMVLFLKHVHLQKIGAPAGVSLSSRDVGGDLTG